jgi:hypothetical protein
MVSELTLALAFDAAFALAAGLALTAFALVAGLAGDFGAFGIGISVFLVSGLDNNSALLFGFARLLCAVPAIACIFPL